jgi:hypothetical protein
MVASIGFARHNVLLNVGLASTALVEESGGEAQVSWPCVSLHERSLARLTVAQRTDHGAYIAFQRRPCRAALISGDSWTTDRRIRASGPPPWCHRRVPRPSSVRHPRLCRRGRTHRLTVTPWLQMVRLRWVRPTRFRSHQWEACPCCTTPRVPHIRHGTGGTLEGVAWEAREDGKPDGSGTRGCIPRAHR